MDILGPILQLSFRAIVVVLPLTVTILAFRRLLLSQSANAWIYAAACLFSSIAVIGLVPWATGFRDISGSFLLFSALCPLMWVAVIMLCDPSDATSHYDREDAVDVALPEDAIIPFRARPLVLEKPDWPDAPVPIFRHASTAIVRTPERVEDDLGDRSLLSIARGMRRNSNSDARRPKMLPAPKNKDLQLTFLTRS